MANIDSSGMLVAGKFRLNVKHGDLSQVQVRYLDDFEFKDRRGN